MSTQFSLEYAQQALTARDPQLVDILLEIIAAIPDPSAPPPPTGRYTFEEFRREINTPNFYSQPADIQQQFRVEKISLLETDQPEQSLSERLKSFEIILDLWNSNGSFERTCLLKLIRNVPLVYGPWKALKLIFKEAEQAGDNEVLAALSHRFEIGAFDARTEVSKRTLNYLNRRCWRYLRELSIAMPGVYPDVAADFLAEYTNSSRFNWVAHHIFFHDDKKYTRTRFRAYYSRKKGEELLKHRAYADLWKRSPLPLFSLLERARSDKIRSYAVAALKKDFRNVLRDVEPQWVKRLLSSDHEPVQSFAVWVLENVPKFEQAKFRELGLHDAVIGLFNSCNDGPLLYVSAYARTHARDLSVEDLIRLANHNKSEFFTRSKKGSESVRKLAVDLLKTHEPRKEVGLDNWGRLLETEFGYELAEKTLRQHFGAKDLTPNWFADRFQSKSKNAVRFAIDRILDIHPAKKLGPEYFLDLLLSDKSSRQLTSAFAADQLTKFDLDEMDSRWFEKLLLHPTAVHRVVRWVSGGLLSASKFDPEFLKSIAYHPTWPTCLQVVEAKQQPWGASLVYDERIAANVFSWLGDIRLFTPEQIGFQWLMELVGRGEPAYHDFAVATMSKCFLPADFAEQDGASTEKIDASDEQEINIDFEGATFVFTGKLATMTRDEAKKKVNAANGTNSGTVGKSLGYLVIGDEGSPMYGQGRKGSKQVKAESLVETGATIKIISETAFLQMLTGTQREFSEDVVLSGCETLWAMLTESPKERSPLAKFALRYLREHHPEICLEETDRPVDPGSEVPESFLTFDRIKSLLLSKRLSLRTFGLELSKWEFARWSPGLDKLIELCESPHQQVREFVTNAILADDLPQNRRVRLDPVSFTADSVFELCQSRDQQVRSLGMQLIALYPRLRKPDQLFKLTESPDRAVRAFVIRAFWSIYRDRGTTDNWKPTSSEDTAHSKTSKTSGSEKPDSESHGPGSPVRPDELPAEHLQLQFLLRRMLFEISPGPPPRSTGPSLENLKLKPIPTRRGKILLVETLRDLAIEDNGFARVVLPVLTEFMNSQGMSEHDVCLVAVARIEVAHPKLQTVQWRDEQVEGAAS